MLVGNGVEQESQGCCLQLSAPSLPDLPTFKSSRSCDQEQACHRHCAMHHWLTQPMEFRHCMDTEHTVLKVTYDSGIASEMHAGWYLPATGGNIWKTEEVFLLASVFLKEDTLFRDVVGFVCVR